MTMQKHKMEMFWIEFAYWFGIGADALWAMALLFPPMFGVLIGNPNFDPDLQTRLIMGMGASLMSGWTFLLLWAVRKPIERRFVILLTAFPVVFGLITVALIGLFSGNASNIWIIAKSSLLILSMTASYVLADQSSMRSAAAQSTP